MATILEKLQEQYPTAPGIDDARNIAEAMACITRTGGRGTGSIADTIKDHYTIKYDPNGLEGEPVVKTHPFVNGVCTYDFLAIDQVPWEIPDGKTIVWGAAPNATTGINPGQHSTRYLYSDSTVVRFITLYAILKDA